MYRNSVKEEKKLLNLALKYREEIGEEDFNAIVSLCYGGIMGKKINDSINRVIIPACNRITKTMVNINYGRK